MKIAHAEWKAEAVARYGADPMKWKFRCPLCSTVTSIQEWKDANAMSMAAFSCIGRTQPKPRDAFSAKGSGPCNYAGGGLFALNPIEVEMDGEIRQTFDFADRPFVDPLRGGG